jgi:hypothetical protein
MSPISRTPSGHPLNILAVLSADGPCGPGALAALKRHYTLICPSAQQAQESAPSFQPNVVVFDASLADGSFFETMLDDETAFIALRTAESTGEPPIGIRSTIDAPIAERELELLLAQIGAELEADRPLTLTSA